jgi:hypothetical protein
MFATGLQIAHKLDLSFQMMIEVRFDNGTKLGELIDLVTSHQLTPNNAKEVMSVISKGDQRQPTDIAKVMNLLGAKDIDLRELV